MKKTKDRTSRFTLRVPLNVKAALAKRARVEGRSINAQAVQIIQDGLRARQVNAG